jgi:hypothetical protein
MTYLPETIAFYTNEHQRKKAPIRSIKMCFVRGALEICGLSRFIQLTIFTLHKLFSGKTHDSRFYGGTGNVNILNRFISTFFFAKKQNKNFFTLVLHEHTHILFCFAFFSSHKKSGTCNSLADFYRSEPVRGHLGAARHLFDSGHERVQGKPLSI